MSDIILTLGGVAFRDFEVPEQIIFGGRQAIAVHQIIGGDRLVEALGAADGEILLSGVFSGPDAALRAQALDTARGLGAPLPLAWRGFFFSVIIEALDLAYTKPWWIPFRLKLVVARNLVTALPTALGQAALDVASALGFAALGGISLGGVSTASLPSIDGGLGIADNALSAAGAGFDRNVAMLNGAADPETGAQAIRNAASGAGNLAGLAGIHAYLGRASALAGEVSA